jgi:hypothetical protein
MSGNSGYQYLAPNPKSAYRQLFVKGSRIRALIAARALNPDPEDDYYPTPEDVARDLNIPIEAVHEAVRYCESNPPEIAYDFRREELLIEASNMNHPEYKYRPQELYRPLTADDYLRIERQLESEFGRP